MIQFIHKGVNLPVGGGDLAFEAGFRVGGGGGGEVFVERQHRLDERHHTIMLFDISFVFEVDGMNGEVFELRPLYLWESFFSIR